MLHCSFTRLHGNQLGKDDKNTTTTQLCWLLFRHDVCVCAVNIYVLPHSINTATYVYWRIASPRKKIQACRLGVQNGMKPNIDTYNELPQIEILVR